MDDKLFGIDVSKTAIEQTDTEDIVSKSRKARHHGKISVQHDAEQIDELSSEREDDFDPMIETDDVTEYNLQVDSNREMDLHLDDRSTDEGLSKN